MNFWLKSNFMSRGFINFATEQNSSNLNNKLFTCLKLVKKLHVYKQFSFNFQALLKSINYLKNSSFFLYKFSFLLMTFCKIIEEVFHQPSYINPTFYRLHWPFFKYVQRGDSGTLGPSRIAPKICVPIVIVLGLAARIDHRVNRTSPAKYFRLRNDRRPPAQ